MTSAKSIKTFICIFLSLQLSNIVPVAASEILISTDKAVSEIEKSEMLSERAENERAVHQFLNRSQIKDSLVSRGLSSEEATLRLASLSDSEMKFLAQNIEQEKAGGILVEILIVVLIIFLIKRM